MSKKEVERIKILSRVVGGDLSQILASKQLGISDRQVRNLLKKQELEGDQGIVSKQRGKRSNRRLDDALKEKALQLVREYYYDFGPTLASEYLESRDGIKVSKETLRNWMIEAKIWFPGKRKVNLHPLRPRRGYFGELCQVDGSLHAWFEDRAPDCVLMVCVDDATSTITSLHFSETESLEAYFALFEKHLKTYGIPLNIYGDRCSVLTPRNPKDNEDCTQFKLALNELGCALILARSSQAKGRVERANETLQDRLVKDLRLQNISTIQEANAMLEEFRKQYNRRFAKKPGQQGDAHRALDGVNLEHILCIRDTRTLTKDFTIQFHNTFYQISTQDKRIDLCRGSKIEIRQLRNQKLVAMFREKQLSITPLSQVESPILDEKQFLEWKACKHYTPPVTHPYKHGYHLHKIRGEMLAEGKYNSLSSISPLVKASLVPLSL
jgi:transposase